MATKFLNLQPLKGFQVEVLSPYVNGKFKLLLRSLGRSLPCAKDVLYNDKYVKTALDAFNSFNPKNDDDELAQKFQEKINFNDDDLNRAFFIYKEFLSSPSSDFFWIKNEVCISNGTENNISFLLGFLVLLRLLVISKDRSFLYLNIILDILFDVRLFYLLKKLPKPFSLLIAQGFSEVLYSCFKSDAEAFTFYVAIRFSQLIENSTFRFFVAYFAFFRKLLKKIIFCRPIDLTVLMLKVTTTILDFFIQRNDEKSERVFFCFLNLWEDLLNVAKELVDLDLVPIDSFLQLFLSSFSDVQGLGRVLLAKLKNLLDLECYFGDKSYFMEELYKEAMFLLYS